MVFSWMTEPTALEGDAGNYEGEIEITYTDGVRPDHLRYRQVQAETTSKMAYATITEGVAAAQVAAQQPVAMAALDEQGRYPFLADSFTVTDSINLVRVLFRTAADNINMSDALAREFHRPLQDSVAITEARTSVATTPRADTTTVTDSLTTAMNCMRSFVGQHRGDRRARVLQRAAGDAQRRHNHHRGARRRGDHAPRRHRDDLRRSDYVTQHASRAHRQRHDYGRSIVKAVGKTQAETVTAADSGAYQVYNYGSNDYFAEEYVLAATGTSLMPTTIVTRAGKGSALTNTELDANFTNLKATAPRAPARWWHAHRPACAER